MTAEQETTVANKLSVEQNVTARRNGSDPKKQARETEADSKEYLWNVKPGKKNLILIGLLAGSYSAKDLAEEIEAVFRDELEVKAKLRRAKEIREGLHWIELDKLSDKPKILDAAYKLLWRDRTRVHIFTDEHPRDRVGLEAMSKKAEDERMQGKRVEIYNMGVKLDGVRTWAWDDEDQKLVKVMEACGSRSVTNTKNFIFQLSDGLQYNSEETREWAKIKNNVIVDGWVNGYGDEDKLKSQVHQFFKTWLDKPPKITNVTRLGVSLYRVQLGSFNEKEYVMENRHRLKNLTRPIHIYPDMTASEKKMSKAIRDRINAELATGSRVTRGQNYIVVDGKRFIWRPRVEQLVEAPPPIALADKEELHENKMDRLEKHRRKQNIVVIGSFVETHSERELKTVLAKRIAKDLMIWTKFEEIRKIAPDTCVARLQNYMDKVRIIKTKKRLREQNSTIRIFPDQTLQERIMIREITKRAHHEKAKGKNVYVMYGKMFVDGVKWYWDERQNCIVKVTPDSPPHFSCPITPAC